MIIHRDLRKRRYLVWKDFLRQSENWSRQQIEEYQLNELKRIVRWAYINTQGYRRLIDDADISPDSIGSLEDIRKLPFVDKKTLRDAPQEFSTGLNQKTYVTTGGSTGIPFGFYRDSTAFAKELASKAHQYHRIGWREGDRQLVLRGVPIKNNRRMRFFPSFNELRCSTYYMTPECMERFRIAACDYQPHWIRCYPSAGAMFARYIVDSGKPFPAVKGVLCASENLYDDQKELMQRAFGGRIFSHYGHYEMAVLAGYCEYEDSYHVLPQYGYAELLDQEGNPVTESGKAGEIVGMSFIMRATPFIRYRTGDIAVLKGFECRACGRPYQVWERIEGRLQDFIVTGRGRLISMTAVNMHDDIFDKVLQFRFHQSRKGDVEFRFIPRSGCNAELIERIRLGLKTKLGDDVELTMKPVTEIPLTKRGKHLFLEQNLDLSAYGWI